MKIGLFAFKENVGCTSMAVHLAFYLASDKNNNVCLREIDKKAHFNKIKAERNEDNTFILNNTCFLPYGTKISLDKYNFIIDDIGKLGILFKFDTDYDLLYACTDGSLEDLSSYEEYIADNGKINNMEILLFGGSKDLIHMWQEKGFKVTQIGTQKEKRIPQNFALKVSTFLRIKQITPPIYQADINYDPVIFTDENYEYVKEEIKENPTQTEVLTENNDLNDNESFASVKEVEEKEIKKLDDGKGLLFHEETFVEETKRKDKKEKKEQKIYVEEEKSKEDNTPKEKEVLNETNVRETIISSNKKIFGKQDNKNNDNNNIVHNNDTVSDVDISNDNVNLNNNGDKDKTKKENKEKYNKDEKNKDKALKEKEVIKPNVKVKTFDVNIHLPSFKFKRKERTVCEDDNTEDTFVKSLANEEYYEKDKLSFDEIFDCKDLSKFVIMRVGNKYYFGLKEFVKNKSYDNKTNTLLVLNNVTADTVQFITKDLLSGAFVLRPFDSNDILCCKTYFDFIYHAFLREINKNATIGEYAEFKEYYNNLCEMKFMLDEQIRARKRLIHDLYIEYYDYVELYNVKARDENDLLCEDIDGFIEDLKFILKEHIYDKNSADLLKNLIERIENIKVKEETKEEIASEEENLKTDNSLENDDDTKETVTEEKVSDVTENDTYEENSLMDYKLCVKLYNEEHKQYENATYHKQNEERAIYTYMVSNAFLKELYINDTLLYTSKKGSILIPNSNISAEELKVKLHIDEIIKDY